MNSLNIISAHVIGTTPKPVRSRSVSDDLRSKESIPAQPKRSASQHSIFKTVQTEANDAAPNDKPGNEGENKENMEIEHPDTDYVDEKTPLLEEPLSEISETKESIRGPHLSIKRIFDALTESIKWVLTKLAAPGVLLISCFYDDDGRFSAAAPIRKLRRKRVHRSSLQSTATVGLSGVSDNSESENYLSRDRGDKLLWMKGEYKQGDLFV
jgi:CTD nuclear envelope phosphatase 1